MFLIAGSVFLILLALTLIMLWGHERLSLKKFIPRAKVEECWTEEERRQHPRVRTALEVEYAVEKRPHLKNGKTVDMSKGGMKLLLEEKLPIGAIIDIKLYIPEEKKTIEVEGEISWTKDADNKDPSGKRLFHSGVKFTGIKEPSGTHLADYLKSLNG